ncbi:MAG: hypothetical protein ACJ739_00540 [Acidimicrobiales bacterium]
MGIGVSILLIAAGAIMTFAVDVESSGSFNINTIGIILMIVGALGFIATLTIFSGRRGDTVVETRRDVY